MPESTASLKISVDSRDVKNAKTDLDNLSKSSGNAENSAKQTTSAFKGLGIALSTVAVGALAKEFVQTADAMNMLNARLRLVTSSLEEYKSQQTALLKISKDSYSPLADAISLYTKLDPALKRIGATTAGVNEVVDSFSKGLKLGGASAAESSAAMLQFAQAMGSGVLRGDEFNSMMEASPKLMSYVAEGMGKPVTALRKLAEEGKLTAGEVSAAMLLMSDKIEADFKTLPKTVSGAITNIKTDLALMVDEINNANGVTSTLANILSDVSITTKNSSDTFLSLGSMVSQTTLDLIDIGKELGGLISAFNDISEDGAGISLFEAGLTGLRISLDTVYVGLHNSIVIAKELVSASKDLFSGKETNFLENVNKQILTMDDLVNRYSTSLEKSTQKQVKNNEEIKKGVLDKKAEAKAILAKADLLRKEAEAEKAKEDAAKKAIKAEEDRLKKSHEIAQSQLKMIQEESDKKIKLQEDYYNTLNDIVQKNDSEKLDGLAKEAFDTFAHYDSLIEKYKEVAGAESALRAMQTMAIDTIIEKQKELDEAYNNKTAIDSLDEIYGRYSKLIDAQIELAENGMNIDFDFGDGAKELNNISKAVQQLHVGSLKYTKQDMKLQEDFAKNFLEAKGDELKEKELIVNFDTDSAKLKEASTAAEIAGYANLAGAMSQYAKDGSAASRALSAAQAALSLVNMVHGISAQSKLPFPLNIAAMAATATAGAGYLRQIGQSISGGGSTSSSSDVISALESNSGKDSSLGDADKQSESIANSLDVLSEFAKPEFSLLAEMNKSLLSIDEKIGGFASLLIREGGFAFGEGFSGYDTGYKNNLNASNNALYEFSPIGLTDKIIEAIGLGDNFIGGILDSALGGLFGKTSVSQSLQDSGIYFADALLEEALNSFNGSAYQTILTETKKKSWFSSSTSNELNTLFDDLDDELENQFELVLSGLYNTTLLAGDALDVSATELSNKLDDFVISIGKISLKDQTGEEIQKTLEAVFGKVGDDIARATFPELAAFQQVGEGMFDTLTRVSTGMEEAEYYIKRLGVAFSDVDYLALVNKQGVIGVEALAQSIEASNNQTHDLSNGLIDLLSSMSETAEEVYSLYSEFSKLGNALEFLSGSGLFLTTSMIGGAGGTDALSSGISTYMEEFLTEAEQASYKVSTLNDEFAKLNLATPKTKDEFKTLLDSFDLTTESGQELYGRVIILSEAFAETSDAIDSLNESLNNTYLKALDIIKDAENVIGDSILVSLDLLLAGKDSISAYVKELRSPYVTSSSTKADFATAYKEMMKSIRNNEPDTQTAIASAIDASKAYLKAFEENATSQRDVDFQNLVMANRFEGVNKVVDKEISDLYIQAEELLGADSEIVKYLSQIDISTSKLTYQQYIDNLTLAKALNTVNSSISSMVLGGVQLSILQDDKGTINALVAEDFQLSVGDDWASTVESLNAGFDWNIPTEFSKLMEGYSWNITDTTSKALQSKYGWSNELTSVIRDELSSAYDWTSDKSNEVSNALQSKYGWSNELTNDVDKALESAYNWKGGTLDGISSVENYLKSAFNWNSEQLANAVRNVTTGTKLEFDWNNDGIKDAVGTVLPDGTTKLEFDWNNDKTVDLSAIIGKNGQLESLVTNTDGTNGTTTSEYLNFLYQIEKDRLKAEGEPLSAKSFAAGHTLGTNEKIDFAKTTGLTIGSADFDKAISDIQGFSTTTTDFAYLRELAGMSGTTVANPEIMQQMKSLSEAGVLPTDANNAYLNVGKALDRNAQNAYNKNQLMATKADTIFDILENNLYAKTSSGWIFDPSVSSVIDSRLAAFGLQSEVAYPDSDFGYSDWVSNSTISALEKKRDALLDAEKQTYFGYSSGGYTGNYGTSEIAGVVHGQEYVVNAKTTADLGLNNSVGLFQTMANELVHLREEVKNMSYRNSVIITKQDKQIDLLKESRDIQNGSLVMLEKIEAVS